MKLATGITVKNDRLDLIHMAKSNCVQGEKNGQEIEKGLKGKEMCFAVEPVCLNHYNLHTAQMASGMEAA